MVYISLLTESAEEEPAPTDNLVAPENPEQQDGSIPAASTLPGSQPSSSAQILQVISLKFLPKIMHCY